MNVTPDGTIAVPLPAVKREIKYATKLGARAPRAGEANIVRLLNVVQEGEARLDVCPLSPSLASSPPSLARRRPSLPRPRRVAHALLPPRPPRPYATAILILVWELVDGVDVLDHLNARGGSLSEREARGLFRQLCRGVSHIHDHGFCHRDIKPENCMIERSTHALKIIDFGLSKHLDSAKTVGIGTPDYMAPEMLAGAGRGAGGDPSYDPQAVDVWAMGVMLYLMLTGSYPFEDPSRPGDLTATLRRVREGRVNAMPRGCGSACVRDLLARMIRAAPGERATLRQVACHPWMMEMDEKEEGVDDDGRGRGAENAPAVANAAESGRRGRGGGGGGGGLPGFAARVKRFMSMK